MTEPARSTFYDRYYGWILLVFVISLPAVVYGVIKSEETNNNNIKQWLPKDLDETKIYDYFRRHFGTDEYAIISWKGCTLDDPRLKQFAELAREYRDPHGEAFFAQVTTGPELLAKLQAKPFELSKKVAKNRLKSIIIGQDGKASAAIVELTEKGDDNRRAAVAVLNDILKKEVKIPADEIHMAGDAVTNAAVDVESQRATDSLVGYSMLIALACAIFSLRNIKLVVVIFVAALFSAVLAQSLVPALGGRVNLVLVVMPVLIYVLALSAGVHLVNYYRDAIQESGLAGAPLSAIQRGWLPCTLAAGTTAIGLASLSVSKIVPVKDFGKYSAIGILASLAVLFLLLPALLVLAQKISRKKSDPTQVHPGAEPVHKFDRFVQFLGQYVIAHYGLISIFCLIGLGFFGWGALYINTSVKPARFFDPDHRLISDYQWLANSERFGNQIPLEIIVKFDRKHSSLTTLSQMQLVEAIEKELLKKQAKYVGTVISAVTFAPELGKSHYTRYVMNKRLAANRDAYEKVHYYSYEGSDKQPAPLPVLPSTAENVNSEIATEGTELEPQVGKDLWRTSTRIRPTDDDYDEVIAEIEKHLDTYLDKRGKLRAEKRKKALERFDKIKRRIDTDSANEREACEESEDRAGCLQRVMQKYEAELANGQKKFENDMRQATDDTTGVDIQYTGMVPLFHIAQRELLRGLFKSFFYAFLLIAVMMIIWFRNPAAGLVTMLPNIFPAAVIFGWMGWTDRIVDIGSMMTASVALGIAVDDTVHFLTWFRRGMQNNLNRNEAVLYSYQRCALAMTQTTLIAGLGLLVFGLSSFQPVSQFGLLMFLLLAAAIVGDLLFLPSLLIGPAGKLFQPKRKCDEPVTAAQKVVERDHISYNMELIA